MSLNKRCFIIYNDVLQMMYRLYTIWLIIIEIYILVEYDNHYDNCTYFFVKSKHVYYTYK